MESESASNLGRNLRLISEQFFCCTAIKKLNWKNFLEEISCGNEDESQKLQDLLLTQTINHPLNLKLPLKKSYQQDFLKFIILTLEERQVEVSELLYSKFQELLNSTTPRSDFSFKHYSLPDGQFVSLNESTSIISEGTTGLCSWQGAFVLAEWCLQNSSLLKGKRILELGSGIGLTGLVVCKTCRPKYISFTDVHATVLRELCSNVRINTDGNDRINSECYSQSSDVLLNFQWDDVRVLVLKLDWETFDLDSVFEELDFPDIILAADVVYDPSLITPLCNVLNSFFNKKEDILVVFACTIRSQETHELFLKTLGGMSMTPKPILQNTDRVIHYNIVGTVLLYSITKEK